MNTDKTYDCETCGKYHTRQKTKQFLYPVFSKIAQASVGTIPHGIKAIVMIADMAENIQFLNPGVKLWRFFF